MGEVNTVPVITTEERMAALEKAKRVRAMRKELCRRLKCGQIGIEEFMDDPVASRVRVKRMLESMPGVSSAGAVSIMADIGISETRRVGGIGRRQRAALLEMMGA